MNLVLSGRGWEDMEKQCCDSLLPGADPLDQNVPCSELPWHPTYKSWQDYCRHRKLSPSPSPSPTPSPYPVATPGSGWSDWPYRGKLAAQKKLCIAERCDPKRKPLMANRTRAALCKKQCASRAKDWVRNFGTGLSGMGHGCGCGCPCQQQGMSGLSSILDVSGPSFGGSALVSMLGPVVGLGALIGFSVKGKNGALIGGAVPLAAVALWYAVRKR